MPTTIARRRRFTISVLVSSLVALLIIPGLQPAEALTAPAEIPSPGTSWELDFYDTFTTGTVPDPAKWSRYSGTSKDSTPTKWLATNSTVSGGRLVLKSQYDGKQWFTGGSANGRLGGWLYGKFSVRYRVDKANGLGYAFLLYPAGGGWPPELDIAEDGGGTRQQTMSTLHYDSDNKQTRGYANADFSTWHTMSVDWSQDRMEIFRDGISVVVFTGAKVPRVKMWLGLQGLNKKCSTVYKNCPYSSTPSTAKIEIDWVAHWRKK